MDRFDFEQKFKKSSKFFGEKNFENFGTYAPPWTRPCLYMVPFLTIFYRYGQGALGQLRVGFFSNFWNFQFGQTMAKNFKFEKISWKNPKIPNLKNGPRRAKIIRIIIRVLIPGLARILLFIPS